MLGTTIGRYRILELLGKGGMGEVYLAEDPELGRKVALKFLPERLHGDAPARARLVREARAAAALDHPFICKIYETGEAGGTPYIVMEYVRGSTLRARLAAAPMPLQQALSAATELAEALEAAHDQGIIHRDLKPANVVLSEQGHIKILDFGLAKQLAPSGGVTTPTAQSTPTETQVTFPGAVIGTAAYMSPEQVRAQPATRQSDIFSFGVVLYEMLTGAHPFIRGTPNETAHAILNDREPPLARYAPGSPVPLQQTLSRMLAKDPAERYQTVREVRTALGAISDSQGGRFQPPRERLSPGLKTALAVVVAASVGGALLGGPAIDRWFRASFAREAAPGIARSSIAVLPFLDMSSEADQEYFCDGIADQIISALAGIEGLHVTARTSAWAFKGHGQDVRTIGRKLNVAKLLEGSVRKAGNRLRITVQLVNTADGFQTWSKAYDRNLDDILTIQDEIAQEVVRVFRLSPANDAGLPSRHHTPKTEAYDLYLRGRFFWNKRTPESLQKAEQLFQQALAIDPGYALAYVGVADAQDLLHIYTGASALEAESVGKAAIVKALDLDDGLAEAHAAYGGIKEREWDWGGADKEYRRAIQLKPGDATIRSWYAQFLALQARHLAAISEMQRARSLDPLSPYVNCVFGNVLYLGREYREAKQHLAASLELDSNYHVAHTTLAYLLAVDGSPQAAVESATKAAAIAGDAETSVVLGFAFARAGMRVEAGRILDRLVKLYRDGKGSPGRVAVVHAGLGDRDRAMEWLEMARKEHDIWMTLVKVDPVFDGLRSDDRFRTLLRQLDVL